MNFPFVKGRLMKYQFPSSSPETIANVECAMTTNKIEVTKGRALAVMFQHFHPKTREMNAYKNNIDNLCPEGRKASNFDNASNANTSQSVSMAIKVPILFHKFNHPWQ